MTRSLDFRYRIMRGGADYGELYPAANASPRISMRSSNAVKTSFSGTFLPPEKDVDWMSDEIRPEILLDGVTYGLGIFRPIKVQRIDDGTAESLSISANDRCWTVRDTRSESRVYFAAGTNYVAAAVSVLTGAGISVINAAATDATLDEDREWPIGTSRLDIVNELLTEINYGQLWFDGSGAAMIRPVRIPAAVNISHVLDETKIESLLLPGIQSETDVLSAANVFICVCSNADKDDVMTAVAENTNPQSPLSIARRGKRITKVIQINNISSQEALQAFANRQVSDSMMAGEVITAKTCLLPGFGVDDVTSIRYGDLMAICRESAWTMDLKVGGQMTHTLERTVMTIG